MKLAVKNIVADLAGLLAVPTVGITTDLFYWVTSENTAYYYCAKGKGNQGVVLANIKEGDPIPNILRPNDKLLNEDLGRWVKDDTVKPGYLVPDNYDFAANNATELDFTSSLALNNRFLSLDYTPTANDVAVLATLLGVSESLSLLSVPEVCIPSVITQSFNISDSGTFSLTLTGSGFSDNTYALISGAENLTIDSIVNSGGTSLRITVTTDSASIGSFDLLLLVSGETILAGTVNISSIPSGAEKFLRNTAATFSYAGTAFARNFRNNNYLPVNLFDNNSGTRHQPDRNDFNAHFAGIIMSVPTLLTMFAIHRLGTCKDFRIEGSNDTTDGSDGTWTEIDSFTNVSDLTLYSVSGTPVYLAFRVVWLVDNRNNGARELFLVGRQ